jgi:hypothetical protein
MKKADLIAQLEGAKALTSVVSIDNVIALIQQLDAEVKVEKEIGFTEEVADKILAAIERTLDYNASNLVDRDSASFCLSYNGREIELDEAELDVHSAMQHISEVVGEFIVEEDEDEDTEEGVLKDAEE